VKPDRKQLEAVMVRRLKSEVKNWDGSDHFAKRLPLPIEVPYTTAEKRIHSALQEYTRFRSAAYRDATEQYATEFVLKPLKKRLFSSPQAFADTLAKHEQSVRSSRRKTVIAQPSLRLLQREFDRIEEEFDDEEEQESTNDAVLAAAQTFRPLAGEEERLLGEMRTWAERASAPLDSKAARLIAWLEETIRPRGQWSNERVIIFTEYRATQNWLYGILANRGFASNDRLMMLHGSLDSVDRERIKAAFQFDPAGSPVRILLATDAASEGIDLQNHCHRLIHYEIPWNPNRMEQRNGRIDRHGQRAKEVLVYHFVGQGYNSAAPAAKPGDLEGDLEFLMRAAVKINTIREDLGKVGPVIAEQVEEAMLGKRRQLDTDRAERDAEPVRRLLKFERDLRTQVERLAGQIQETRRELRLAPENIHSVVRIALALAGQPPLMPVAVEGGLRTYRVPEFREPSWAPCLEGLRHPHTQEVRPIVFDPELAKGRDDVVLAHLNHRLVQMCLRLLRAEIWAPPDVRKIHRVAARIVPNRVLDAPAVIAHARLVLVSGDSQRLHEEVIAAGGLVREGRFTRLGVTEVKNALAEQLDTEPGEEAKQRFRAVWPQLATPLYQALDARQRERTAAIQKVLAERAGDEAAKIRAIMLELERAIRGELEDPSFQQLTFDFSSLEREQFARNADSLRARLEAIPGELEKEIEQIRARFADPDPRLFPVAVTFLIPQRLAGGAD
jgi:superfamily II DNA/RNA helicase